MSGSALHEAATYGKVEVLRLLIQSGSYNFRGQQFYGLVTEAPFVQIDSQYTIVYIQNLLTGIQWV